ncbi:hypothetical protein ACVLB3_000216 [Pseudarthrobacter sp. PvP022]
MIRPGDDDRLGQAQQILDEDARPALSYSVPGRFDESWQAFIPSKGTYQESFVNPASWPVNLDACSSRSTRRITDYTFDVTGVGSWNVTRKTSNCSLKVQLPKLGNYVVNLTLHTAWGGGTEGVSREHRQVITVKDRLIVVIGDSLASGEGNPDKPGQYVTRGDDTFYAEMSVWFTVKDVEWADRRCHRSKNSGPARAARSFEDSHTSVTFLSFACSGARIWELIDTRYAGAEPPPKSTIGSTLILPTLPPQILAARESVRRPGEASGRVIDALIVSAGINDLHFSTIISNCVTTVIRNGCVGAPACWPGGYKPVKRPGSYDALYVPADRIGHSPATPHRPEIAGHIDCLGDGGISDQIDGARGEDPALRKKYDALADAIQVHLPQTREIYVNDYPADVFKGGACGKLHLQGRGLGEADGRSMRAWGDRLNQKVSQAAHKYRVDSHRWNKISSLTELFTDHSYCPAGSVAEAIQGGIGNQSWFTSYESSYKTQGNKLGTAHPNDNGHIAYGNAIRNAMVMDPPAKPYQMKMVLLEVKAERDSSGPYDIELSMQEYQNDNVLVRRFLPVVRDGNWRPVPEDVARFNLAIFPAPASPRHATYIYASVGQVLPIHHVLRDAYGRGEHEITNSVAGLSLKYKIELEKPPPEPGSVFR